MKKALILVLCALVLVSVSGCVKPHQTEEQATEPPAGSFIWEESYRLTYGIIENREQNTYDFIQSNADGVWKCVGRLEKTSEEVQLIGLYQSRLYFHDEKGISFFDLNETEPARRDWIVYPQSNADYETMAMTRLMVGHAEIVGDCLYFDCVNYTVFDKGGILSLSLKDDASPEDAVVVVAEANGSWHIDRNADAILYEHYKDTSLELCKVGLASREPEVVYDNLTNCWFGSGNVLVFNQDNELYLYSPASGNSSLVYDAKQEDNSETFYNRVAFYDDAVFYLQGNDLVGYQDGQTHILYTFPDAGISTMVCLSGTVIEIMYEDGTIQYLVKGVLQDTSPLEAEKITVAYAGGDRAEFMYKDVFSYYIEN